MNLWDRITNGLARRMVSFWSDKFSWGSGGLFAPGQMANSGVLVDPNRALGLTSYYAALQRISTDAASLPCQVFKYRDPANHDKGRDLIPDHPVSLLFNDSPNGETPPIVWRQAILGHRLGWGNGYAEIETDRGGRPIALHLLDPASTQPDRKPQDKRLYYRLSNGTLPPAKVLHLAGFGYDGLRGYSPAHLHREAIGLGLAAERTGGAFFGNGSRLSGVIKLPYKLKDQAAVDQLKRNWNTEYSGPDNTGKVAVLEQGAEFQATGIPPQDAQYLQIRQFQVIEIARMFGIPPHKIGDYSSTGSAYRALEEANLDYLITTIVPMCVSIEQAVNLKLLTAEERTRGFHVEHDVSALLRGDSNARGQLYERLMGLTVLTPNQIATREGLNPFGKDGDRRYISVQFTPLEIALQPKPVPAPPGGPPDGSQDGGEPDGDEPAPKPDDPAKRFALNGNGSHREP